MSIFSLQSSVLRDALADDLDQILAKNTSLTPLLRAIWVVEASQDPSIRAMRLEKMLNILESLENTPLPARHYGLLHHGLEGLETQVRVGTGRALSRGARATVASCLAWVGLTCGRRASPLERASIEVLDGQTAPVRVQLPPPSLMPKNDIATVRIELLDGQMSILTVPRATPGVWVGRATVAPAQRGGAFASWDVAWLEDGSGGRGRGG